MKAIFFCLLGIILLNGAGSNSSIIQPEVDGIVGVDLFDAPTITIDHDSDDVVLFATQVSTCSSVFVCSVVCQDVKDNEPAPFNPRAPPLLS